MCVKDLKVHRHRIWFLKALAGLSLHENITVRPFLKQTNENMVQGFSSLGEGLPRVHKVLGSIPSTAHTHTPAFIERLHLQARSCVWSSFQACASEPEPPQSLKVRSRHFLQVEAHRLCEVEVPARGHTAVGEGQVLSGIWARHSCLEVTP